MLIPPRKGPNTKRKDSNAFLETFPCCAVRMEAGRRAEYEIGQSRRNHALETQILTIFSSAYLAEEYRGCSSSFLSPFPGPPTLQFDIFDEAGHDVERGAARRFW